MPAERYFVERLEEGVIEGDEYHHLTRVMRSRPGEHIEVVNGQGSLVYATLQRLEKGYATFSIEKQISETPPSPTLILAQALPRPQRLDYVIEKGTELGADAFWFFPGDYSAIKEWSGHRGQRARALTIAALKQCGRLWLPSLIWHPSLTEWSSLAQPTFFGDLHPSAPPFAHALKADSVQTASSLLFVTGPESGFSEEEREMLIARGAKGVSLHPYILRTDTASLAALTLLSHARLCQSHLI